MEELIKKTEHESLELYENVSSILKSFISSEKKEKKIENNDLFFNFYKIEMSLDNSFLQKDNLNKNVITIFLYFEEGILTNKWCYSNLEFFIRKYFYQKNGLHFNEEILFKFALENMENNCTYLKNIASIIKFSNKSYFNKIIKEKIKFVHYDPFVKDVNNLIKKSELKEIDDKLKELKSTVEKWSKNDAFLKYILFENQTKAPIFSNFSSKDDLLLAIDEIQKYFYNTLSQLLYFEKESHFFSKKRQIDEYVKKGIEPKGWLII